ncbi:4'-phosphopantetheinyl transferase superfamily protein [Vogesella sp. LYT5W]|uniref:Enterobactin synthase component D n=1 Tax=Vogesella margarita TaxID=2984199 RepID=A0ABT5ISL8_9NEIS|nr:4'-phosphopantetheinyl transferase superfamily protein [Vogesella margarita]MDC7715502.1 4'-phosphopantetheinyl transferase superfamily protein [Vogesella margarita]
MGASLVSQRLEQLRPGSLAQLFAAPEAARLPAWPGTMLRQLSLPRLAALVHELPLAGVVPNCAQAVRSRQLAHLAGRLCAEAALEALGGNRHAVGQDSGGAPRWPAGMLGSITHDAHGALALVAHRHDYRWLGIDVEPVLDEPGCAAVCEVCLTAAERTQLAASRDAAAETTLRFSAKEAYYKAVFPQLGCDLDFLDVELAPMPAGSTRFRVLPLGRAALQAKLPPLEGHFAIDNGRVFCGIAC